MGNRQSGLNKPKMSEMESLAKKLSLNNWVCYKTLKTAPVKKITVFFFFGYTNFEQTVVLKPGMYSF